MHAIRERRELELRSYAKINLALDVTGIRPDGYHSVDTIMQRVSRSKSAGSRRMARTRLSPRTSS